jgi:hypothetical protein
VVDERIAPRADPHAEGGQPLVICAFDWGSLLMVTSVNRTRGMS